MRTVSRNLSHYTHTPFYHRVVNFGSFSVEAVLTWVQKILKTPLLSWGKLVCIKSQPQSYTTHLLEAKSCHTVSSDEEHYGCQWISGGKHSKQPFQQMKDYLASIRSSQKVNTLLLLFFFPGNITNYKMKLGRLEHLD